METSINDPSEASQPGDPAGCGVETVDCDVLKTPDCTATHATDESDVEPRHRSDQKAEMNSTTNQGPTHYLVLLGKVFIVPHVGGTTAEVREWCEARLHTERSAGGLDGDARLEHRGES